MPLGTGQAEELLLGASKCPLWITTLPPSAISSGSPGQSLLLTPSGLSPFLPGFFSLGKYLLWLRELLPWLQVSQELRVQVGL